VVGHGVALDHAWHAFGSDAAGEVDRVAPEVVNEFLPAQHAGDDRSGTDTDADFQMRSIDREVAAQQVAHGNRHVGDRRCVVIDLLIEAAGDHVGVADGLDLFEAVVFRQFIEGGKDPVQHREYL
jgi:hypothetical protein